MELVAETLMNDVGVYLCAVCNDEPMRYPRGVCSRCIGIMRSVMPAIKALAEYTAFASGPGTVSVPIPLLEPFKGFA